MIIPLFGVVLSSVRYEVADHDALIRLSVGRYLWEHGLTPSRDPFTFAVPNTPWADPEWLGDLGLFTVFRCSSERHLQLTVIGLACLGYAVAFALAIDLGGNTSVALALLLSTIATTAPRISARNDVHLLWLLPTCACLARRAVDSVKCCVCLALCLWFWAQVHSSFVLGALLILGSIIERRDKRSPTLFGLLALMPCLPLLGFSGAATYYQLYDHLVGARIYHSLLSEWMSPLTSDGWLAILPLHLITLLGVVCLAVKRSRVRALPLTLFVVGVALAYSSRRFLPMLACAITPGIAGGLTDLLRGVKRRASAIFTLCGLVATLAYTGVTVRSAQHRPIASVFSRSNGPEPAVRFITSNAPLGSRVFNAFDEGPWLMWFGRPDISHYIDPRNQLGAPHLMRYTTLLDQPSEFDKTAENLSVNLALIPHNVTVTNKLLRHLGAARDWRLVFWDGGYSLFAHVTQNNGTLIKQNAYQALRPTLDLRYLDANTLNSDALRQDLARLSQQSQLLANIVRAYAVLRSAEAPSVQTEKATAAIEKAWPLLPETYELARALSELPLVKSQTNPSSSAPPTRKSIE